MSENNDAPKPSRGGSGVILSGLAVTALLGAPVAAAAVAGAEPTGHVEAVRACAPSRALPADAIREQFRTSFTAGAVTAADKAMLPIICDPL
jgi:hypothetical protein